MASYQELFSIRNEPPVVQKTQCAIADVARDILDETTGPNLAARLDWAKEAIARPGLKTPQIIHFILIENKSVTPAQIEGATDNAYKTNVTTAVAKLVGAAS